MRFLLLIPVGIVVVCACLLLTAWFWPGPPSLEKQYERYLEKARKAHRRDPELSIFYSERADALRERIEERDGRAVPDRVPPQ